MTDLVIRPLTVTDDRDQYADLAIRAFGPKDPAGLWARTVPAIADGRGLGAFDGGRLVGSALFHDLRQWWLGRAVPMAGVSGVKVAPEYRGRGAGRALMMALTGLMISRGYPLSVLYPATMPIYRQLGWEQAGVTYLAEVIDVLGRAHELARDCGPITFSEAMVRRWLTAPGRYLDTGNFAYLAPDGFLAYRWDGGGLSIDTIVAASPETTRAMWSVVASHSSVARRVRAQIAPADPIWWLLREQDATIAIRKQWMLRLLDAPVAIAARGFPPVDLTVPLHISDEQVPANSGHWNLTVRSGSGQLARTFASVSPGTVVRPLRLGARGLAALYAGVPVATLRWAGLVSGGTEEACAALDAAFAASAFMLDDF